MNAAIKRRKKILTTYFRIDFPVTVKLIAMIMIAIHRRVETKET